MKKDLTNIQMLLNPRGIHGASFWFADNVHQGALGGKYGGKTHKTRDISTIDKATGLKWVSIIRHEPLDKEIAVSRATTWF